MFLIQKCIKEHKPTVKDINNDESNVYGDFGGDPQSPSSNNGSSPSFGFGDVNNVETQATIIKLLSVSDREAAPDMKEYGLETGKKGEGGKSDNMIDKVPTQRLYGLLSVENDKMIKDIVNTSDGALNNNGGELDEPDEQDEYEGDLQQDGNGGGANVTGAGGGQSPVSVGSHGSHDSPGSPRSPGSPSVGGISAVAIKFTIMEQIRQRLLNETYKYPYWVKYLSIGCIVIWTLMCAIITTIWCLWFEMQLEMTNNYTTKINSQIANCSLYSINGYGESNLQIALKTVINGNVTQYEMDDIFDYYSANGNSLYKPTNSNDSFASGAMDVTIRFLVCVLISYLLSIFVWQPLIIAIKSALKLRSLNKHPDRINEAALFYHETNLRSDFNIASNVKSGGKNNANGSQNSLAGDDGDNGDNGDNDAPGTEMVNVNLTVNVYKSDHDDNDVNDLAIANTLNDSPNMVDELQKSFEVTSLTTVGTNGKFKSDHEQKKSDDEKENGNDKDNDDEEIDVVFEEIVKQLSKDGEDTLKVGNEYQD